MSFQSLEQLLGQQARGELPPVSDWNPDFCGDIDIRIDKQGTWYHEGSEFKREKLVKLFASILKKEGNEYFLVTPVEKLRIQVEDLPFQIIMIHKDDDGLQAATNMGDMITIDQQHPITLSQFDDGEVPEVEIRNGLKARFNRSSYYQLVDLAEERAGQLVVSSHGCEFVLGEF